MTARCLTEAESFVFSTKLPHFLNKPGAEDGDSTGTGGAVFSKDEWSFSFTPFWAPFEACSAHFKGNKKKQPQLQLLLSSSLHQNKDNTYEIE